MGRGGHLISSASFPSHQSSKKPQLSENRLLSLGLLSCARSSSVLTCASHSLPYISRAHLLKLKLLSLFNFFLKKANPTLVINCAKTCSSSPANLGIKTSDSQHPQLPDWEDHSKFFLAGKGSSYLETWLEMGQLFIPQDL